MSFFAASRSSGIAAEGFVLKACPFVRTRATEARQKGTHTTVPDLLTLEVAPAFQGGTLA
jgi:hypothetical protein